MQILIQALLQDHQLEHPLLICRLDLPSDKHGILVHTPGVLSLIQSRLDCRSIIDRIQGR